MRIVVFLLNILSMTENWNQMFWTNKVLKIYFRGIHWLELDCYCFIQIVFKYHITVIILANVEFQLFKSINLQIFYHCYHFVLNICIAEITFFIIVFPSFRYLKHQLFMMSNKNFTKRVSIFIYKNLCQFIFKLAQICL